LADLEKGDPNIFADGKWLGYRETPLEALLVFGKTISPTNFTISALKNVGGFIVPPASVEVWGGMNKNNLKLLARIIPAQPTEAETKQKDFVNTENIILECSFKPVELKYMKVVMKPVAKLPKWHSGKGEKGWVFTDEVFVN
jgi:hypothetical protein